MAACRVASSALTSHSLSPRAVVPHRLLQLDGQGGPILGRLHLHSYTYDKRARPLLLLLISALTPPPVAELAIARGRKALGNHELLGASGATNALAKAHRLEVG